MPAVCGRMAAGADELWSTLGKPASGYQNYKDWKPGQSEIS